MPLENHNLLELVETKTEKGSYCLYPEFVDQLGGFQLETLTNHKKLSGSREVYLVQPMHSTASPFVAKVERQDNDHYRDKFKCKGKDLAVWEISVARVLSKLATFEDESVFVRFEQPYGVYIDPNGRRINLFKYIPEVAGAPKIWDIPGSIPHSLQEARNSSSSDTRNYQWLSNKTRNFFHPSSLARIIMGGNGIEHNEPMTKDGASIDPESEKSGVHVLDFEFTKRLPPPEISKTIWREIKYLYNIYDHRLKVPNFLKADLEKNIVDEATKLLPERTDELTRRMEDMANRIKNLLPPGVFQEDREFGPAYKLIMAIPERLETLCRHA